eukprot:115141-Chlamydomonas_euryale.AAC.1
MLVNLENTYQQPITCTGPSLASDRTAQVGFFAEMGVGVRERTSAVSRPCWWMHAESNDHTFEKDAILSCMTSRKVGTARTRERSVGSRAVQ